eukprot:69229-Rhodomonas_salina.1
MENLTIAFTAAMSIGVGENVTVHLPQTTCLPASSCDSFSTGMGEGKWDTSSASITFTLASATIQGDLVAFDLPQDLRFTLVDEGMQVTSSPNGWTISTDAASGAVTTSQLFTATQIGAFSSTPAVVFTPAVAGRVSAIDITLTMVNDAAAGDALRVTLPQFMRRSNMTMPSGDVLVVPPFESISADILVAEDGVTVEMEFSPGNAPAAGQEVIFRISSALGIMLPANGVALNGSGISVTLTQPGAAFSILCDVPAVGAFVQNPVIAFDPPYAGAVVNVSLLLTPAMEMMEYESFVLDLPGIDGPSTAFAAVLGGLDGDRFTARWSSDCPTSSAVILTVKQGSSVAAMEQLELKIPSSLGLTLPTNVLILNSASMTISTKAASGPVLGSRIDLENLFGTLTSVSFDFRFAYGGLAHGFILSFVPGMRILPGDTMYLKLGSAFTVPFTACISAISVPGGLFAFAEWSQETSLLKFVWTQAVDAEQQVRVVIPATSGLTVSADATTSDRVVQMNFTAALGMVPWSSMDPFNGSTFDAPTVSLTASSFGDTPAISFDPPKAGNVVNISLSFSPGFPLMEFESLVLHLPAFTGPNVSFAPVLGGLSGQIFSARWSSGCPSKTLTLTVRDGYTVGPNELVDVVIPSDLGIALPLAGVSSASVGNVTVSRTVGKIAGIPLN